jgi:hypothetical protein
MVREQLLYDLGEEVTGEVVLSFRMSPECERVVNVIRGVIAPPSLKLCPSVRCVVMKFHFALFSQEGRAHEDEH